MEGTINNILNAYQNLTTQLLKQLSSDFGEAAAKELYSMANIKALEEAGFKDDIDEARKKSDIRNALMSIIGKTFTVGGDE